MCDNCRNLKYGRSSFMATKNGLHEAHDITGLRMLREKTGEYRVDFVVKPSDGDEQVWIQSKEEIHYCPFCGEKL